MLINQTFNTMKLKLLIALAVIFTIYACSETESELPQPSDQSGIESKGLPFKVRPIDQLVEISNGFFWVGDKAQQGVGFRENQLACKKEFPNAEFQQSQIKASAKPGFYKAADQMVFYNDGVISVDFYTVKNCITKYVYVPRDCPRGQLGAIKLEIEECYNTLTGALISSDTTQVPGGVPCMSIIYPELKEYYFEDAYGNKYVNPICF